MSFYGLSISGRASLPTFYSLSIEDPSNITIEIRDQFGVLIPNVVIQLSKDSGQTETITLDTGQYFDTLEQSTDFEITVQESNIIHESEQIIFSLDGQLDKIKVVNVRRAIFYRARAIGANTNSLFTSPIKSQNP